MTRVTDPTASPSPERGAFDDLLAVLARPLDLPDLLQQLTAIARRIVPHDESEPILSSDRGHLAQQQAARQTPSAALTDLGRPEHETIARVLGECRRNKPRAARRLGLSRTQLYIRMRRHGIDEPPKG